MKLKIEYLDVGFDKAIDPDKIKEILKKDKKQEIKGVLTTYTDTSSSSKNNIKELTFIYPLEKSKSGIITNKVYRPDLSWSLIDISRIIKRYTNGEYILLQDADLELDVKDSKEIYEIFK